MNIRMLHHSFITLFACMISSYHGVKYTLKFLLHLCKIEISVKSGPANWTTCFGQYMITSAFKFYFVVHVWYYQSVLMGDTLAVMTK